MLDFECPFKWWFDCITRWERRGHSSTQDEGNWKYWQLDENIEFTEKSGLAKGRNNKEQGILVQSDSIGRKISKRKGFLWLRCQNS